MREVLWRIAEGVRCKKLQAAELSMIFPVRNVEQEIAGILSFAADQAGEINTEYIIVDMGSSDRTVFQSVRWMKLRGLHGFVVQNGESDVSSALNTGLQKAEGRYITFVFARRLYEGFLPAYLETANRSQADFVFGCFGKEEARAAERRNVSSAIRQPGGNEFLKDILRKGNGADIAAVLIRRGFLQEKSIQFHDGCSYGYAEEFLCRCFLQASSVVQAPAVLQRNMQPELKRGKQKPVGKRIFQRVEATLRVIDVVKTLYPHDTDLLQLLERNRLPAAVMSGVDVMLREGNSFQEIRSSVRDFGFDRYLVIGRQTEARLRNRIALWRTVPWLYRA